MSTRWLSGARRLCVVGLLLMSALDVAALRVYWSETAQIQALVGRLVASDTPPVVAMRKLTRFLVEDIPNERPDVYFLAPVFERLRPTAWQVVEHGGDCAYKARALIVMMRQLGVSASKVALYDRSGTPVHAAAVVDTDQGDYVVDLKYGIVYDDERGAPIALKDLATKPDVFYAALDREVAEGNALVAEYPRTRYVYSDVRTINWHESWPMATAYAVLVSAFGQDAINGLTRPYIAEEPAFLVLALSGGLKLVLVATVMVLSFRRRSQQLSVPAVAMPA